jgi:hypothetical protein
MVMCNFLRVKRKIRKQKGKVPRDFRSLIFNQASSFRSTIHAMNPYEYGSTLDIRWKQKFCTVRKEIIFKSLLTDVMFESQ